MEKVVRAQIATDGSNISSRWLAQQQQLPSSKNNRSFRFFSGAQIKSQIMLHVCGGVSMWPYILLWRGGGSNFSGCPVEVQLEAQSIKSQCTNLKFK
jgi:hypothetical protein